MSIIAKIGLEEYYKKSELEEWKKNGANYGKLHKNAILFLSRFHLINTEPKFTLPKKIHSGMKKKNN